jgi:hypothetical protein
MMASRSQYSASSMKCVVTITVTPCPASALMRDQNSRRASGSTPEVGSSRNRISRLVHQRAGQREALLVTERQVAAGEVRHGRQFEFPQRPVNTLLPARAGQIVGAAEEAQIPSATLRFP